MVLWIFALIMAYPYLPGSGTEAFKGVSVVLGVMISLGSTTIVGQLFSGFMLLYARVFKVGDFVRIGDVEGTVDAKGLFATKITTHWNDEYELNAHIEKPAERIAVLTALHASIQDAFNEHGVQIMSPHYFDDPRSAKVVPPSQWYPAPARRKAE